MRLSDFIEANTQKIATEWEAFARALAPGVGKLLLRDHIEEILAAVVNDMRAYQSQCDQEEKGKGRKSDETTPGGLDEAAEDHAQQRLDLGLDAEEAASEFRALRASIVRMWEESSPEPKHAIRDLIRFNEALDQTLIGSLKAYTEYTEKVNRYRDQFLAILGHDLRTPLGAIMTWAEIINRQEDIDHRCSQAATWILNGATRMKGMVEDLLDLTRVQLGGAFPVTLRPVDLETVCRRVLDEIEGCHADRVLRFDSKGDLRGDWDAERLAQMVSNLVVNAVQHGDETAPIDVSAHAQDDEVLFAVHNQGAAIPREELGKVFEPLVRGESAATTRKSPEGLGLGLFIVREIATAHGGTVSVSSSQDEGTTFTVRLPRRPRPGAGSA